MDESNWERHFSKVYISFRNTYINVVLNSIYKNHLPFFIVEKWYIYLEMMLGLRLGLRANRSFSFYVSFFFFLVS